ncbi:hypothetical protein CQW23_21329 [Capsicum baccatum]|uniref:5'-nucleotidase domain-containing protein n=1 Tax=Capsicum baccatum TaxID=33114 RepID=A0A2G2VXP6_CAPBA|nr:hypothetical protein CQW23_21329 [Capsicum baccatum]
MKTSQSFSALSLLSSSSVFFLIQIKACLIADIVQHFVDAKLEFDARYVYQDVNRAIQYVHNSGLVHRGILAGSPRYLVKNDQLFRFLKMLKDKGKKLFLLTNSPFYFVDGEMRFMLQRKREEGDELSLCEIVKKELCGENLTEND